jgi:hypothetical protein
LQKLALRVPDVALHNGKIPSIIPSEAGKSLFGFAVAHSPQANKDVASNGEQLSQNL